MICYTDRQQETQRESEEEVTGVKAGGRRREGGEGEEKHTVVHSLNQRCQMECKGNRKIIIMREIRFYLEM